MKEGILSRIFSRQAPPWMRAARAVLLGLILLFVAFAVIVMIFEDRMIYFPTKFPEGNWRAPQASPLPIEDVSFQAPDGVKLHGWFVRGKEAKKTILFFHGNAGNLSDRYLWTVDLALLPANVFIIDYRGYGRSEGKPNEAGIYLDAEAAYKWLTETKGVDPKDLFLYGKSLGGAPACEIASRFPCGGVILQSTFSSAGDMARVMMPFFPAGRFVRTKFDNVGKVAKITAPKLIVHSTDDEMIPYRMAEKLHEAAGEPKTLKAFRGAGHNDLIAAHGDELLATIGAFLE